MAKRKNNDQIVESGMNKRTIRSSVGARNLIRGVQGSDASKSSYATKISEELVARFVNGLDPCFKWGHSASSKYITA